MVVHAKNNFQKELQHSRRVKESDLEDLNLGMADDPKIVKIGTWLPREFKEKLTAILQEYKDVFAWSYDEIKCIDPKFYQHHIQLQEDANPVKQQRYTMNTKYALQVKEEIDKLLKVWFIKPIAKAAWLSLIVVLPKKNGKLHICMDYHKLNTATVNDPFPLPFTDMILDTVAGRLQPSKDGREPREDSFCNKMGGFCGSCHECSNWRTR